MNMHPDMAGSLARDHHHDLVERAHRARTLAGAHGRRRHVPRMHVSWTRAALAAAGTSGRPGRSWVIIISATRGA
jgi:hypothetical protein